jgi:hypothetical protein
MLYNGTIQYKCKSYMTCRSNIHTVQDVLYELVTPAKGVVYSMNWMTWSSLGSELDSLPGPLLVTL